MASFKSDNNLRGEVRRGAGGLMDVRLWRGETEIAVKEMVADDYGVDFTAVLNEEVPPPAPPALPADEQAAAGLTDDQKAAIHQKAEDDAKAAAAAQAKVEADAKAQAEADAKAQKDAQVATVDATDRSTGKKASG